MIAREALRDMPDATLAEVAANVDAYAREAELENRLERQRNEQEG